MKKSKKVLLSTLLTLGLISILSGLVYADVDYDFTLPTTGSKYTNFDRKTTGDSYSLNYVSYVGWEDTINCWVNNNSGGQLTSTSSFSSEGRVHMYYAGSLGKDYYGHDVQMQIKTGTTVWHPIDIVGCFDAH